MLELPRSKSQVQPREPRELRSWFGEFQPVAPGIVSIESFAGIKRIVPSAADSCFRKFLKQMVDVVNRECRMGLASGAKILINADVKLFIPDLEPAPSARTKRYRFFDLFKTEQLSEEIAGLRFATGWRCDLNVIDSVQQGFYYGADPASEQMVSVVQSFRWYAARVLSSRGPGFQLEQPEPCPRGKRETSAQALSSRRAQSHICKANS